MMNCEDSKSCLGGDDVNNKILVTHFATTKCKVLFTVVYAPVEPNDRDCSECYVSKVCRRHGSFCKLPPPLLPQVVQQKFYKLRETATHTCFDASINSILAYLIIILSHIEDMDGLNSRCLL